MASNIHEKRFKDTTLLHSISFAFAILLSKTVIDRLIDTLDQRIEKWAKQQKYVNSTLGRKLLDRKGKRRIALLEDKLTTALDLSAAFEYLHSKNILFRDLKPGTSNHIEFDMTFVFLEF
mmetsp:Transcript_34284/g.83173  ORF Transcript_34284/g.83173 Transcript_34284/m.83173 type:complete len:120 (-) Transcript_34284:905-1264(-)